VTFGPVWRGLPWLAALIGGIVLAGIVAIVLGLAASPRRQPSP
jgi:hypothetical protein